MWLKPIISWHKLPRPTVAELVEAKVGAIENLAVTEL
jgi:hypothetical protein